MFSESKVASGDSLWAVFFRYGTNRMVQEVDYQYEHIKKGPTHVRLYMIALVVGILLILFFNLCR